MPMLYASWWCFELSTDSVCTCLLSQDARVCKGNSNGFNKKNIVVMGNAELHSDSVSGIKNGEQCSWSKDWGTEQSRMCWLSMKDKKCPWACIPWRERVIRHNRWIFLLGVIAFYCCDNRTWGQLIEEFIGVYGSRGLDSIVTVHQWQAWWPEKSWEITY